VDALNSHDLTDNSTVLSSTGRIGIGAEFEAAAGDPYERLSITDNFSLSAGDTAFTITAWVKLESDNDVRTILSKAGTAGQREYQVYFNNSTNDYYINIYDGTSSVALAQTTTSSSGVGVWDFIIAGHDTVNNEAFVSINLGGTGTDTETGTVSDGTDSFLIGAFNASFNPWDGTIDCVFFTKRLLTDFEKLMLYNNGHGMEYYFDLGSWDRRN
jgi:hypothetical protein